MPTTGSGSSTTVIDAAPSQNFKTEAMALRERRIEWKWTMTIVAILAMIVPDTVVAMGGRKGQGKNVGCTAMI